jgi:hypothetical protein
MRHLIYTLGDAMFKPFTIFLLLAFMACKQKKQPATSIVKTDTIVPITDTAFLPYTMPGWVRDTLEWRHEMDSFYAIQPQAVFITDKRSEALRKLIAAAIDTSGVTVIPIKFSDTSISTFGKEENIVSIRNIYKSNRFTIQVFDRNVEKFIPKKISVNGQELRAGIEIDTSLYYDEYFYHFELNDEECAIMKFGNKDYLFLTGGIGNCSGRACGVNFYILYDPVIRKGMLLQQFRSEFIAGYDKKNKTPLFVDMSGANEYNDFFQCFMRDGKVYRLNSNCKAKPVTDKTGKQQHFTAYSKDDPDTIKLIAGNLPVNK